MQSALKARFTQLNVRQVKLTSGAPALSANQPFCDGSHKGTEFSPVAFKAEESKKTYFCGCKKTENMPLCDGSHNR